MERDYLEDRIAHDVENDPGFASEWAPYAVMLEIAKARKAKGLSQQAIADEMKIDRSKVARIENHPESVSFGRILAYAKAVGVKLEAVSVADSGLPSVAPLTRRGRPVR